jgi:hypothetical protein
MSKNNIGYGLEVQPIKSLLIQRYIHPLPKSGEKRIPKSVLSFINGYQRQPKETDGQG